MAKPDDKKPDPQPDKGKPPADPPGPPTDPGPKDVAIIVNTREKTVPKGKITFEKVVELAFGEVPTGDGITITVTYRRGQADHPQGSLVAGGSVEVVKGMVFDVSRTDRS
jgi:hypothetical protein